MNENRNIKLIECPRDAMQGWKAFIPAETKIKYINSLLKVGFDTIDFGSFVSPKAIPQMADTGEVVKRLELGTAGTKLLAIIANMRGAEEASVYDEITYLGFPKPIEIYTTNCLPVLMQRFCISSTLPNDCSTVELVLRC